MQSEEPTIIQSLENHLAEYGHTTVGQDIAAAILVIKDLHQKAALYAAEPVGWQWRNPRWTVGGQWQHCPDGPREDKLPDTEYRPVYAAPPAPAAVVKPSELDGVPDALAYGKGIWRTCTGCHESNEGYPTGPFSDTLKCHLGGGCFECGGIGAVWDTTDYEDMGNFIALSAQVQDVAIPEGWQLVPIEPTQEMLDACGPKPKHWDATPSSRRVRESADRMRREDYKTMLAAAPAKQEGGHD